MPQRALIDHRPWLLLAVLAAITYYFVRDTALGGVWVMLIKGMSVSFLSFYALRRSDHRDAQVLALFLGFSALGDMGIELSLELGGALFFAAHLAGMVLFLRNLRAAPVGSQKALAVGLLMGAPLISYLLTQDLQIALYSLALGGMASGAWMSRFPRYRVGFGAVLFVISDWLIFAREGVLEASNLPDLFVWPIYFVAQFLIATGVVQTLRGEHPKSRI